MLSGVFCDVPLFLEQGNVFHGVPDGIFRCGVVHPPQEPLGVHEPDGRHIVGLGGVSLDHEILRDDAVDVLGFACQKLPLPSEPIVAGVALDVFLQDLRGVVFRAQGETHDDDVALVAVTEVGPEKLLGHLRDVRRIGAVERRQPHLAVQFVP